MAKKKRPPLKRRAFVCPGCQRDISYEHAKTYCLFFGKCLYCKADVENGVNK